MKSAAEVDEKMLEALEAESSFKEETNDSFPDTSQKKKKKTKEESVEKEETKPKEEKEEKKKKKKKERNEDEKETKKKEKKKNKDEEKAASSAYVIVYHVKLNKWHDKNVFSREDVFYRLCNQVIANFDNTKFMINFKCANLCEN